MLLLPLITPLPAPSVCCGWGGPWAWLWLDMDQRCGWEARLTLLELRWRREAVGCVGPVRAPAWTVEGSVASKRKVLGCAEVLVDDTELATEAECARSALSSRVRRLTTASCSSSSS